MTVDDVLKRLGLPRTRENYLAVLYDGPPPEEWDEDVESTLPPELRLDSVRSPDGTPE